MELVAVYPYPELAQLLADETCTEPLLLPHFVDDTLLILGQRRPPGPRGPVQVWDPPPLPVLLRQLPYPPVYHPVQDGDFTDGPVLQIHDVLAEDANPLIREICHLGRSA